MGLIHHIERTIKINPGREIENLEKHFSFKTFQDISKKKSQLDWNVTESYFSGCVRDIDAVLMKWRCCQW